MATKAICFCFSEVKKKISLKQMFHWLFDTNFIKSFIPFFYTPGIYAEGYIVFVFPFVCSFVRLFVRSFVRTSFRHVEFASKFCVKVSQVVYISATTHQKAFIFGP